jgi:hypothetical protein
MGRHAQCFWCSVCQALRCAMVGFFGIGCWLCHVALIGTDDLPVAAAPLDSNSESKVQ